MKNDVKNILEKIKLKESEKKKLEKQVKASEKEINELKNELNSLISDELSLNGIFENEDVIILVENKTSTKINVEEVLKRIETDKKLKDSFFKCLENGMPCSISTKFKTELMKLYPNNYDNFLSITNKEELSVVNKNE